MNTQELIAYALTKPYAYADMPFGDGNILIKVGKHYFASFFVLKGRDSMTVKGDSEYHIALRESYPEYIERGWHCPPVQARYNSTVDLTGDMPKDELIKMIDISYEYTLSKFTRKEREELYSHKCD